MKDKKFKITVTQDGPFLVQGGLLIDEQTIVVDDSGFSVDYQKTDEFPAAENYSLCRCGKTKNAPFCDGSHSKEKFKGAETAKRESFNYRCQKYEGPELVLCDADDLCAFARFCDLGDRVWRLVEESDDEEKKKLCIKEADLCPAGRLVVLDKKTGKSLEKKYPPMISVIEDPAQGVSGPIWLKGSIPVISADGYEYEVREKQTLCRCGRSENKPFCNGAHASCDFKAMKKSP